MTANPSLSCNISIHRKRNLCECRPAASLLRAASQGLSAERVGCSAMPSYMASPSLTRPSAQAFRARIIVKKAAASLSDATSDRRLDIAGISCVLPTYLHADQHVDLDA